MHDLSNLSLNGDQSAQRTPFGKEMLKHFQFDPTYKNMNHGAFGTHPRIVRDKMREFQDRMEAQPDLFLRYEYPRMLDQSRAAVAGILKAPVSAVVLVPNASIGVNTVLRNMVWNADGRDEILHFNTIYSGCGRTVEHICESTPDAVKARKINIEYPLEDSTLLAKFRQAVRESRESSHRPRIAVFDTITSGPGVRMPFEELTAICHSEGVLSLIDGAHGIGQISLDLESLDPDFFVSNCHKWLYTPRACAVFYVPDRNQAMIRSTLPTSHGFIPRDEDITAQILPIDDKSTFTANFEFTGTWDNAPFICIPEAIKFRQEVCGGEDDIMMYCQNLAREGGRKVAEILGTKTLDNEGQTISQCAMTNVLLPLKLSSKKVPGRNIIRGSYGPDATTWMVDTLAREYRTFLAIYQFQGEWWARLSAQVYLDMEDFLWIGRVLKEVCVRAEQEQHLS